MGQYFAAMYPDKVKRMIIDGVYNSNNYRAGLWDSNLADIDDNIDMLFSYCHQAGPDRCDIYEYSPVPSISNSVSQARTV